MSYKNTISIGKTIDVLKDIYGKKLMSYKISMGKTIDVIKKYDIYGEKKWMSSKNTISIGKTIDVLKDIYGKNH